jgi:CspA family cold shock protein
MEQPRIAGTIKWFSDSKGYGFITRESGDDVFCHFSSIRFGGPRSLNEGDKVEFSIEQNPRGGKAADLVVLEAAPGGRSSRWQA